jgi:hypothetical protein
MPAIAVAKGPCKTCLSVSPSARLARTYLQQPRPFNQTQCPYIARQRPLTQPRRALHHALHHHTAQGAQQCFVCFHTWYARPAACVVGSSSRRDMSGPMVSKEPPPAMAFGPSPGPGPALAAAASNKASMSARSNLHVENKPRARTCYQCV